MDVLHGCSKIIGIEMLLRTMGPEVIAVDEITAEEDSLVLMHAMNCGVTLLATAHAHCIEDLKRRQIYRTLLDNRVFDYVLILKRDKTYDVERLNV